MMMAVLLRVQVVTPTRSAAQVAQAGGGGGGGDDTVAKHSQTQRRELVIVLFCVQVVTPTRSAAEGGATAWFESVCFVPKGKTGGWRVCLRRVKARHVEQGGGCDVVWQKWWRMV